MWRGIRPAGAWRPCGRDVQRATKDGLDAEGVALGHRRLSRSTAREARCLSVLLLNWMDGRALVYLAAMWEMTSRFQSPTYTPGMIASELALPQSATTKMHLCMSVGSSVVVESGCTEPAMSVRTVESPAASRRRLRAAVSAWARGDRASAGMSTRTP